LGYGITLIAIGLLEVLWFGAANSALQTTIELGYNSSSAMPPITSAVRVIPLLIGLLLLAPVVSKRARAFVPARIKFTKGVRNFLVIVGGYLIAWPVVLWLGVNSDGALRTMTIPDSATGYVVGIITTVAEGFSRGDDSTAAPHPSSTPASCSSCSDFSSGLRAGPTCRACICSSPGFSLRPWRPPRSSSSGRCRELVREVRRRQHRHRGPVHDWGDVIGHGRERDERHRISLFLGVLVAGVLGALLGWVLAVMSLRYQANQIIVGIVIVAFCTAVTQFITSQVLDVHQNLNGAFPLPVWAIPFFSHIPIVGPILFDQNILVYVAILGVIIVNIALFRTRGVCGCARSGKSPSPQRPWA